MGILLSSEKSSGFKRLIRKMGEHGDLKIFEAGFLSHLAF